MSTRDAAATTSYAEQAAKTAATRKPGTWEAVQALAEATARRPQVERVRRRFTR